MWCGLHLLRVCSDPSLAEMAADLLRMGRSNMRQALDWLKQGQQQSGGSGSTDLAALQHLCRV